MGVWDAKSEAERAAWAFVPLVSVGPLHFGANLYEVRLALDGQPPVSSIDRRNMIRSGHYRDLGVTVYFMQERLYVVAIDALRGPQVTYEDQALVGRVPSEIEQWMWTEHHEHRHELRYTHAADPELADLGLIVRVQRAGDMVLTRPVFLDQRAEVTWDYMPSEEWNAWAP
jgi:hypothetical protein